MLILVTGGTGVIGRATVTELLRRGHRVRLFSRGADEDAGAWEHGVEPFAGDVGDPDSVRNAAANCHAVVHIVGIVEESGDDVTFERINLEGTRNILAEAERAGVSRFIFMSSLGADRGISDYHRSKLDGEKLVRASPLSWTILRTGAVIGPRDETVSVLLKMVRVLPAVPLIDDGEQPFQPVWHEDVAWSIAECLERDDVSRQLLNITGADVLTVRELIDLFGTVTDRSPLRVSLPSFLAKAGSSLASAIGIETPVSAATVQMLLEGNYLRDGEPNDLTERLGRQPVPRRERLVQLVDALPEQTPEDGVGQLQRRRFHIDIHGGRFPAHELNQRFRDGFSRIVPFEAAAEPGTATRLEDGATFTLELPARGHVQVRVARMDDTSVTLATLEGHPLAGLVRFRFEDRARDTVRFTIDVVERPASRLDQISMALVGTFAQKRTWMSTAENVCEEAGGSAPDGVVEESWSLDDEAAEPIEEWARELVQDREKRQDNRV